MVRGGRATRRGARRGGPHGPARGAVRRRGGDHEQPRRRRRRGPSEGPRPAVRRHRHGRQRRRSPQPSPPAPPTATTTLLTARITLRLPDEPEGPRRGGCRSCPAVAEHLAGRGDPRRGTTRRRRPANGVGSASTSPDGLAEPPDPHHPAPRQPSQEDPMHRFDTPTPPRLTIEFRAGTIAIDTADVAETTVDLQPRHDSKATRDAMAATMIEQRGDEIVVLVPSPSRRAARPLGGPRPDRHGSSRHDAARQRRIGRHRRHRSLRHDDGDDRQRRRRDRRRRRTQPVCAAAVVACASPRSPRTPTW